MINHCEMCNTIIRENHFHFAGKIYHPECAEAMGIVRCPDCGLIYDSTNETHDCNEDPE